MTRRLLQTFASRVIGSGNGPPTTGSYRVGSLVYDTLGNVYICTTAGTPGTWEQVNPGGELDAAFSSVDKTGLTGVGPADTDISLTYDEPDGPYAIEYFEPTIQHAAAFSYNVFLQIREGATLLGQSKGFLITHGTVPNCGVALRAVAYMDAPVTPTERTVKGQLATSSASAANSLIRNAIGSNTRASLRILSR